tara:strand:+ start:10750 stop:11385 length:636 start_codon:yes stop_codon:yes gene_type:complete
MSDENGVKPHTRGCLKTFREVKAYLKADLYRYSGEVSIKQFWKHFIFTPGYQYTVWMRYCGYLKVQSKLLKPWYAIVKLLLLRCRYKYGIAIPEYTKIGPGLFINRFGGVYVGGDAEIGSNVNITHGTLFGYTNRGERKGCPIIGDNTFFGSGAKVIGKVTIGNGAVVGVNAVVTKDIEENGVAVGIPAKVVSHAGSEGYVNRKVKLPLEY